VPVICFPNAKINLGLYIKGKRADGFHDLETVFYPVKWCDALELIENPGSSEPFVLSQSGITLEGKFTDNILYKTWNIIRCEAELPALRVHLHKHIPVGAGLGGGSADAAFFLKAVNERFSLGIHHERLQAIALSAGSDCPFFLENRPSFAEGRGERLSPIDLDLSGYLILLVNPGVHVSTAKAFDDAKTLGCPEEWKNILLTPVPNWKDKVGNCFEPAVFLKYPEVKDLKREMYNKGALYASMSGSGSTVFGIFEEMPDTSWIPAAYRYFLQTR
jgi:4-diphosphocytidyl-2-C-methyl-D-erythritol kinase